MTEEMKTEAPATTAMVARSNTISGAPGPTIFAPRLSNWKKLVCDGSIPVGPEGNTKSTLETCPALAPCQRLLFANTSRTSSHEQLVAKMKPRFPFMYANNLSNPALGQSLWPICKPFRITVFLTQNLCPTPKGNTERSISAGKLHGLSERDHNGSRRDLPHLQEGHGTSRNDNLFRARRHPMTREGNFRWNPALLLHQ